MRAKADARAVRTQSAASSGLPAVSADASRLRDGGGGRAGRGARLELAPAFRLAVEGQRRNANAGPEHTIMLRGSLRW